MAKSFVYPINRPLKTIPELLNEPMVIGFSTASDWHLSSYNPLYSPRMDYIKDIVIYIPVTNKQIVKRVSSGDYTVAGVDYINTVFDNPNADLLLEATLRHDTFLSPMLRVLGVYANVSYATGVPSNKSFYTSSELTADLLFIQTFKPLYRHPNLTQEVRIVISPDRDLGWFADDIHWVNNTDFIY